MDKRVRIGKRRIARVHDALIGGDKTAEGVSWLEFLEDDADDDRRIASFLKMVDAHAMYEEGEAALRRIYEAAYANAVVDFEECLTCDSALAYREAE